MKGKQLFFLLFLAALAAGAWYYFFGRDFGVPQETRTGSKVIEFPINDVAQVKIKTSAREVNLVKKNDVWVVKERGDYPANFEEIGGLVRKLWELKPGQDVKVGPSQLPRLELDEPGKGDKSGTLVEMIGADGKTLAAIVLGKKQARQEGSAGDEMGMAGLGGFPLGRYVKPASSTKVALVTQTFDEVEPKPERWISKDFVKIEGAKSIAVTGQTDAQKWTVTRDTAAGEWKLADAKPDEKVDSNKTFSLGSVFSSPVINDVLAPDVKPETRGLDKPTMAKIETFDGLTYELKIGKSEGESIAVLVSVSANPSKERTPGKDEKPEDKTKLDDEFKAKQKKLEEKLANEQKVAGRIYLVSTFAVDALLKDRSALLPDPAPAEPAPGPAPAPGAAIPFPGAAPAPARVPAPGTPPPPAPKPDAATPPPPAPTAPPPAAPSPAAPSEPAPKPAPAPDAPTPPAPAPAAPPAPAPKPDAATPPVPAPAPSPAPPATPEGAKPTPNP